MKIGIPQDRKDKDKLLKIYQDRYTRSSEYMRSYWETWIRMYKIYRSMADSTDNRDEPNTFLSYSYGIVEQIVSKAVEPIMRMKPPSKVLPKSNGHGEQAERFSNIARNYFSSAEWQLDYVSSFREQVITGNAWELDDWSRKYIKGKRWQKVQKIGTMDKIKSMAGKVIGLKDATTFPYIAEEEVDFLIPKKIGFYTRYPSIFDVLPEPWYKKVEDMHWIAVESKQVAIRDLQDQIIKGSDGQDMPVYDLSELLKDVGEHEEGSIIPVRQWQTTDFGKMSRDIVNPSKDDLDIARNNDIDRIWVVDFYEPNRIVTIAQGKYIIRNIEDPWHEPRIPMRLRTYIQDPQFLFSAGAIEPVEDEIYELNDIHNLSMSQFIRTIYKMMAVHVDALPFPDDLKPRPSGPIRIRTDTDVRQAIMTIPTQNVAPEMIQMESSTKGRLEWATSVSDLSPGPFGTKQGHRTARGIEEIQSNLNNRFITLQRQQLANIQKQMYSMERFFSQFQFEKMPYRQYREDGSTILAEWNKDDIDTGGIGFEYVLEIDPTFGNDQVQRSQQLQLFDLAMKYEGFRNSAKDPTMEQIKVPVIMRRLLMNFGYSDTSQIFQLPNGVKNPSEELLMLTQGQPVKVQDAEDKLHHLTEHIQQIQNPMLTQAIKAGKVNPKTIDWLNMHIQETVKQIQAVMSDPMFASQSKNLLPSNGMQPQGTYR